MFVIAKLVVVALPSVALPVEVIFVAKRLPAVRAVDDAYGNCDAATVDEEKKTPWVNSELVVAAVVVPKSLRYEKIEPPVLAAAQVNWPLFQVRKLFALHVVSDAPKSAVVEAYDALMFVVEAFRNVCVPANMLFV
jgi:hypothetical protein